MKIALVHESVLPRRGGCETYVASLAHRLAADGHQVHLYARRWDEAGLPAGIVYHPVEATSRLRVLRQWSFSGVCRRMLERADHDVSIGFDKVAEYCSQWTLRKTAEVSGVSEKALMQAAELWGQAKSSFLLHARGIEHHSNGVQNAPEIIAASQSGNQLTVTYRVDSDVANATYPLRVDFHADVAGGAGAWLTQDSYPEASAQQQRTVTLLVPAGMRAIPFVATATDAGGRTSELSTAFDVIFEDGFE